MQEITVEDIPAIAEIYAGSFPEPWSRHSFLTLLENPCVSGFIADYAAFILFQAVAGEAEIITIAVKPENRRRGLAKKLVQKLQETYSKIFLEVNETNEAAIGLYESCGFVRTGIRKKYYGGHHDAITMTFRRD